MEGTDKDYSLFFECLNRLMEDATDYIAGQIVSSFDEYRRQFGKLPGSLRTRRLTKKQISRVFSWKIKKLKENKA